MAPWDRNGTTFTPAGAVVDCRFCGWPAEGEDAREAGEVRDRHERYDCPCNPDRVRHIISIPGSPLL